MLIWEMGPNVSTLLVLFAIAVLHVNADWALTRPYQGWALTKADGTGTYARDRTECMASCVRTYGPGCLAASYRSRFLECRHFHKEKIRIYEANLDGITTMITERPEALHVGTIGTFEDAGYMCNFFGGRLMNHSEVIEYYYKREITLCTCGWLSDGSQVQISHSRGNYTCGEGVVTCVPEPEAKAWCRINL